MATGRTNCHVTLFRQVAAPLFHLSLRAPKFFSTKKHPQGVDGRRRRLCHIVEQQVAFHLKGGVERNMKNVDLPGCYEYTVWELFCNNAYQFLGDLLPLSPQSCPGTPSEHSEVGRVADERGRTLQRVRVPQTISRQYAWGGTRHTQGSSWLLSVGSLHLNHAGGVDGCFDLSCQILPHDDYL